MRSPAAAKVEAPTMMQRVDHSRITLLRLASTSCETPVNASRSEEHTSELQSLMRISYAVFCLKKKTYTTTQLTKKTNLTQISHNIQSHSPTILHPHTLFT